MQYMWYEIRVITKLPNSEKSYKGNLLNNSVHAWYDQSATSAALWGHMVYNYQRIYTEREWENVDNDILRPYSF
jgi:hypothetical protein